MKKIITILIFTIILSLGYSQLNLHNIQDLNNLFTYSYCDNPIHYKIDTVDPQFKISKEDFTANVDKAAQIWNRAENKNLFVYDPKGNLSINLIYDERQSLSNEINQLEGDIQNDKQSLNPKIDQYEKESADFKNKVAELNKKVQEWNSKGGAPPDEYKKIIDEQHFLQAEADKLNEMARSLNLSTREYNAEVGKLNQTINVFNNTLEQRPEEGIYKGPENRIEIYFNISQTELIHTLAHELGHALGISHINNPNAIMYFRTNQNIKLSTDDEKALEELCKRHNYIEFVQIFVKDVITKYKSLLNL